MPASFLQAVGATNAAAGSAITASALATNTGDYVFIHASHYTTGMNVSAVEFTGATMTKAGTTQGGDANQDSELWYSINPVVGTTSALAVVKFSGNAQFRIVQAATFSWGGITSISYEAEAAHNLVSASAHVTNSITTTTDDDLLIGMWVAYDFAHTLSSGANTTMIGFAVTYGGADDFGLGYRLAASASAYTMTLVGTNNSYRYSVAGKAFKGVAGGGTATAADMHTLTLTNAGS